MQSVVVIDPPSAIVSLEEAKAHLRVDDGNQEEDALIQALIEAAITMIDGPSGWLGRALGRQTLELRRCGFPSCGWIALPCRPIHEIVSATYDDATGAPQTLGPASYRLYDRMLIRAPNLAWPVAADHPHSLRIRYTAGYDADKVPANAIAAIKLMIGDLYRYRETAQNGAWSNVPMSTTVTALLAPLQVWDL